MLSIKTIKTALNNGYKVHWSNAGYQLRLDQAMKHCDGIGVLYTSNDYYTGFQPCDALKCFLSDSFIVYDNKGATLDRYTIFLNGDKMALGTCETGKSISMFGEAIAGPHLGQEISFPELPQALQIHALQRFA